MPVFGAGNGSPSVSTAFQDCPTDLDCPRNFPVGQVEQNVTIFLQ